MKRLVKFGLVGGTGTIVNMSLLYLLTSYAGLPYLISNIIGVFVALCWTYLLNSRFTFHRSMSVKLWLRYAFSIAVGLVIGETFLWLFTDKFHLWYMLSSVITAGLSFLFNFAMSRLFVWPQYKGVVIDELYVWWDARRNRKEIALAQSHVETK